MNSTHGRINNASNSFRPDGPSRIVLNQLKVLGDQSLLGASKRQKETILRIDWQDIREPLSSSQLLGEGGFAQVYKVYIDKKPYALKCLHSNNQNNKDYTENEFLVAASSLAWEANLHYPELIIKIS